MSISTEITRIQELRNTIRNKLVELNMVESKATLNDCAAAIDGIENRGAVTATIDGLSTMSYTIPKGIHSGSGTVSLTDEIEQALAKI